jgi:uncharacterized membrane protein YebE (DUF533 family)
MHDWFESPVAIDARSAAIIAAGMRAVARADGVIHQRELSLIASFEAEIPPGTPATGKLEDRGVVDAFVRSLIMTALADGVISDAEHDCIAELCAAHGVDASALQEEVLLVKRKFMSTFSGVSLFRESVLRVARDLGLSERELDALSQDA